MTENTYLQKIKTGVIVKADVKSDYLNTLTFDSNKFILKINNFNMNQLNKDLKSIIKKATNLYVYLDFQNFKTEKKLSDQDYINSYNQSISNINALFGDERIILQSSKLIQINNKTTAVKAFLIYCDLPKNNYVNNQEEFLRKIILINGLKDWEYRSLIEVTHQMQLYKTLYESMFIDMPNNKLLNFVNNEKNRSVHGVGLIKKTRKNQKNNEDTYTINNFKIEPEYKECKKDITFKFYIVTNVFETKETTPVLSAIKLFSNNPVQMAILGETKSIRNLYDKKAISFDVYKFDDSKFNLYCSSINILKENEFTHLLTSKIVGSYPIQENDVFYKNNIDKKLTIGMVFENHLKDKIKDYEDEFNQTLQEKLTWASPDDIKINPIQINQNLTKEELIEQLNQANCDCYLCITDIDDYDTENSKKDYYKILKQYNVEQNFANKKPFITQGIIVPSDQTEEIEIDDDQDKEVKKEVFKAKIKTAFYELCTKYIFYSNEIKLTSPMKENDYLIISFDSEHKLCSCVQIKTKDEIIKIIDKKLIQLTTKRSKKFKEDINLINHLSNIINHENIEEFLKKISSYDDFIIYDLTEKNFLLCSNNNTYILSDNEYNLRIGLIKEHKKGKITTKKNKKGEVFESESKFIMSLALPLYNITKKAKMNKVFLFELNNEKHYFVSNDLTKSAEYPQSPLVKMSLSANNPDLLELYFLVITSNVVRNGLNSKTTLFEKFSRLHMVN